MHVSALNKDLGFASASGEFYYRSKDEVGAEKATTQIRSAAPDSRNYDSGVRRNSSVSSLAQHLQPPSATKRPWDKVSNAVSNIGVSSFSSGPSAQGHLSSPAGTQPYMPIVNFAEQAPNSPQRLNASPGMRFDENHRIL
ncbi:hypothetical protein H4R27_002753 [Coemansia aciculifera]|nr:hypothetical protein H4R27_002753 [Coemansia aciculifera]